MPTRTGPISAFLTNTNVPLGTEFDDGLRSGPVLDRTVLGTNGYQPYSYNQWGVGLLNSSDNTYNIVPAGPSATGNVVFAFVPAAAGNLTLAQDGFVTSLKISGSSSPANLSRFVQFDWARALSLTVAGGNFLAPATVTVFGADCWGVPLQEAVTFQNAGTYNMKKAFYTVSGAYYNGAASGGATMSIQTTDTLGLPYRLRSSGDINSIRWGNFSDLGDDAAFISSPVIGSALLAAGGPGGQVFVACSAITAFSSIQVTRDTPAGVVGNLYVPVALVQPGIGFTINSDAAETSTVRWEVINPFGQYAADGISPPMVLGVVTVFTSQVQADSNIQLSMNTFGTASGQYRVTAIVPGVNFTVTSTDLTETSTLNWVIIPRNWNSGTSANMAAGVVVVPTSAAQSNSKILVTHKTVAGTAGVLEVRDIDIVSGVSFTIRSSNILDTSTVSWAILQNVPTLTQGTATIGAGGNVVVPTTGVAANSIIMLTYNTFNTPGTYLQPTNIVAGTSFRIDSQNAADRSTVNWAIFPVNFFLKTFIEPLGTFTPADDTVATNTTGDVRGTYLPSTPANGINVLHISAFISGYDNFVNQQADANLSSGGTAAIPLTRGTITVNDQVGVQQYYTGTHA